MKDIFSKKSLYFSVTSLVLANLSPLVGVLFWDWEIFPILFLYWLESAIVGFYNVLRMWKTTKRGLGTGISGIFTGRTSGSLGKIKFILFFIVHYGFFMMIHGFFVFGLFPGHPVSLREIIFPFTSLFLSHGVSYFVNFIGNEEFRKTSLGQQMARPYKRIFVMQFTIILGMLVVVITGAPSFMVVVMILVKTGLDLGAHLKEHFAFEVS